MILPIKAALEFPGKNINAKCNIRRGNRRRSLEPGAWRQEPGAWSWAGRQEGAGRSARLTWLGGRVAERLRAQRDGLGWASARVTASCRQLEARMASLLGLAAESEGGTEPRWGSAGGGVVGRFTQGWANLSRVELVRLALTLRYGV